MSKGSEITDLWFKNRNWEMFRFQKDVRNAITAGKSGLLNAPTGMGKTMAVWMGLLADYINRNPDWQIKKEKSLKVLWITPLRALAADIGSALQASTAETGISWKVSVRTGDTSSSERSRQSKTPPQALVTTPESLHLLLSQKNTADFFSGLEAIVIDEWHELLGTKRGVQIELAISRLIHICPSLRIWGISATIGNLEEGMKVLTGDFIKESVLIKPEISRKLEIETLIPDEIENFPWTGHLGIRQLPAIIKIIKNHRTTLIFTNTRSQAEIWYQQILLNAPEFAGLLALHHGSLSQPERIWVEDAIGNGKLRAVVCTSTLDLGVDFRPVEAVIQIGGPKGVARFFQRAGRSGHSPFATSKIWFAPTHSLELLEGAALKEAIAHNHFESRRPLKLSYDVLTQYLLTLAAGDGFEPDQIFAEIRKTHAYKELKRKTFDRIILSIVQGGESLSAYEEFRKAEPEGNIFIIKEKSIALRHRLSIGTIVSDPVMKVELRSGKVLGTIEEYFISKLNPGDVFWFSGKNLELLNIKNLSAIVKPAGRKKGVVPQWLGGRMPLSSQLSDIIRRKISSGSYTEPELLKLKNLFDIQQQISVIPRLNQLLIEKLQTKEGFHLFVFPFEGRYVNEALAWLTVHRLSSLVPGTFSIAVNDFGFELLSDTEPPIGKAIDKGLFSLKELYEDLNRSMNFGEMAKRRFREIATIAGLIFQGYPGKSIKNKHLQASAGLLFSVFNQYEPDNLLIQQAYDEVLSLNLDKQRLEKAIKKLETSEIILQNTSQPSPFAFPLLAERMRETMSYEKWEDRIEKLSAKLEKDVRRKG